MTDEKIDILSLTNEKLKAFITDDLQEKPFHAKQIFTWLHQRNCTSFDEMTDLSKNLRESLKDKAAISTLKVLRKQVSKLDGTRKYLFELADGNTIESVFMQYEYGASVCVSTEVGCDMGCSFCASTVGGKVRELTAGEMLSQVYEIEKDSGIRISHVVLMGMGEPLNNLENVLDFIEILTDKNGKNLSERNITISTSGIVPKIRELADKELQITLALSLHASTQGAREKLMPVAKKYSLDETIDAMRYYFEKTGRRVSFEYALIKGENDTDSDVENIYRLLHGINCHLNLIPVNPARGDAFTAPDRQATELFQKKLEKMGINVTIRRALGRDIDGACGELRRKVMN